MNNKYKTYLKNLQTITSIMRSSGVYYTRSYAYRGSRVTRLKFWNVSKRPDLSTEYQCLLKKFVKGIKYMPAAKPSGRFCYSVPASFVVYFNETNKKANR